MNLQNNLKKLGDFGTLEMRKVPMIQNPETTKEKINKLNYVLR